MDRVEIRGELSPADAAAAWAALFPSAGVYSVERVVTLAKAGTAGGAEGSFDEWFLQRLFEASQRRFGTAREAIWSVMDRYLADRGVRAPSEIEQWELQQNLFDLTNASTARMVGLRVPGDVEDRLTRMGWMPADVLDFPAIAYRVGRIYDELQAGRQLTWPELLKHASSRPVSLIEQHAIAHARAHAGIYLKPIFDDTGAVWTGERERAPLQQLTAHAIEERIGARAAATELGRLERAQGIFRDAERVMRTEIAEASGHGNWIEAAKKWTSEQDLYRPTSSTPCKGCLFLYKLPNGMPRLYTRAEVERQDALGPNTGPMRDWHVRIGVTHPNCVCPPWQRWKEASRAIHERRAGAFAELIARLKVFPEEQAA